MPLDEGPDLSLCFTPLPSTQMRTACWRASIFKVRVSLSGVCKAYTDKLTEINWFSVNTGYKEAATNQPSKNLASQLLAHSHLAVKGTKTLLQKPKKVTSYQGKTVIRQERKT